MPLSEDVTSSIPRYIPNELCTLISAVAEDAVVMISGKTNHTKRIYLYKFFFEQDTKLQSAWSYWEVNVNDNAKRILGAGMVDSDLYAVVEYSDGVYLEHIVIRPENVDAGTEIEILLDRKTTESETGVSTTSPPTSAVTSTDRPPDPRRQPCPPIARCSRRLGTSHRSSAIDWASRPADNVRWSTRGTRCWCCTAPVSYTHLTLPTILLV